MCRFKTLGSKAKPLDTSREEKTNPSLPVKKEQSEIDSKKIARRHNKEYRTRKRLRDAEATKNNILRQADEQRLRDVIVKQQEKRAKASTQP